MIPIFILDFLCIHPFNDGNGELSRLLTTLLLYQNDFFVGKYISIERKIEQNKESYYVALEKSNMGWQDSTNDPMPFVNFILNILLAAYKDFEKRVDLVGLKQKNINIIKNVIKKTLGKFTKNKLLELCPTVSKSSIENCLKTLVESNEITRYGKGKNTYYTKNCVILENFR